MKPIPMIAALLRDIMSRMKGRNLKAAHSKAAFNISLTIFCSSFKRLSNQDQARLNQNQVEVYLKYFVYIRLGHHLCRNTT